MAEKAASPALPDKVPLPLPVLVAAEQPPIPVMQVAPDGVTPVPIASLGDAANTPPGSDSPVGQATPVPQARAVGTPVNMTVMAPPSPPHLVTKGEGTTLAPTTTEQEDTVTAGQRLVNMTWELTQSFIAVCVVTFTMIKAFTLSQGNDIPTIMAVAFGTVVGFYFARTNHQSQGGVGKKPIEGPYVGR